MTNAEKMLGDLDDVYVLTFAGLCKISWKALSRHGDALSHMGSYCVARLGGGRETSTIKLHDIVFHSHESQGAITRYENTDRDTQILDNLFHH